MKRALSYILVIVIMVGIVPFMGNDSKAYGMMTAMLVSSMSPSAINILSNGATVTGASGGSLTYDAGNNTIILNDMNLNDSFIMVGPSTSEIATIVVEGTNYISTTTYGIACVGNNGNPSGNLVITGSGVLKIELTTGAALMQGTQDYVALMADGDVIIGGNVNIELIGDCDRTINEGREIYTYGIKARLGSVEIKDSASVKAKGLYVTSADSDVHSFGVWAAGSVTVTGSATLEAYSDSVSTSGSGKNCESNAIFVRYGNFNVGKDATVTAQSSNALSFGNVSENKPISAGVYVKTGNINVEGTLRASSGSASGSDDSGNPQGLSYGVYAESGIDISGNLEADSGTANTSIGINATGDVKGENATISANNIIATGAIDFNGVNFNKTVNVSSGDFTMFKASQMHVTGGAITAALNGSCANATVISAPAVSFADTDVDFTIAANASGSITGIDCNSLTTNDAQLNITDDSSNAAAYGIKAANDVNISGGAVIDAAHVATAGSFTLAEGLHWATAAGVSTTNGAYTLSDDDDYLIVTTTAIVITPPAPHRGGGSGSSGGGGATSEEAENATGSAVTSVTITKEKLESIDTGITFSDTGDRWFSKAAGFAGKVGLMNGRSSGEFAGDAGVTRAEFSTILLRAYALAGGALPQNGTGTIDLAGLSESLKESGSLETASFPDVAGSEWYGDMAKMAFALGIVKGGENGAFGANNPISRQEAMVMIYRLAALLSLEGTNEGGAMGLAGYEDAGDISGWAYEAMGYGVHTGLLEGFDGHIAPTAGITRGQTAAILERMVTLIIEW